MQAVSSSTIPSFIWFIYTLFPHRHLKGKNKQIPQLLRKKAEYILVFHFLDYGKCKMISRGGRDTHSKKYEVHDKLSACILLS